MIVDAANQEATLNADLLIQLLSQGKALAGRRERTTTAANLLPADAQHYAQVTHTLSAPASKSLQDLVAGVRGPDVEV